MRIEFDFVCLLPDDAGADDHIHLSGTLDGGERGDKNYGPDSALYGAMSFVRTSGRAYGLTRKSKGPAAKKA